MSKNHAPDSIEAALATAAERLEFVLQFPDALPADYVNALRLALPSVRSSHRKMVEGLEQTDNAGIIAEQPRFSAVK